MKKQNFTLKPKIILGINIQPEVGEKHIATFSNGKEVARRIRCIKAGVLKDFKKAGDRFLAEYFVGNNPNHYTQYSLINPNENTVLGLDSFFFMKEKDNFLVYYIPKEDKKITSGKISSPMPDQDGKDKDTIYFS